MANTQIRFEDGATYERYMGIWSQLVGAKFLDWLAPKTGLNWLDVGCGNGAFTEMVVERHQPSMITGVDPSAAQIAFARQRLANYPAELHEADAMDLPLADNNIHAAVMPLVIFFVPEPAKGVAEMTRVVTPGGSVSAYAWDMLGGGFPYFSLQQALIAAGISVPRPLSVEASQLTVMHELWLQAGLTKVETAVIKVRRNFVDFADYWETVTGAPSVGPQIRAMTTTQQQTVQAQLRASLPIAADGQISIEAHANAIKGVVAE